MLDEKNVDAFEREKWTMTMEDEVLENLKPVLYRQSLCACFEEFFEAFEASCHVPCSSKKCLLVYMQKSKTPAKKDAHIPLLPFENMIYDTNHKDHSAAQRETCNLCS